MWYKGFLNPLSSREQMLIPIHKISPQGLSLSDTVDLDSGILIEEESYFLEPLEYQVTFMRDGERVRAKGRIKTALSLTCVRCLEHFDFPIHSKYDIVLFPADKVENRSLALDPEEIEYIFFEGDQIDLRKIHSEQINLFTPPNPVCSESCRGICPSCGTNLNHSSCSCEPARRDITFLFEKAKR